MDIGSIYSRSWQLTKRNKPLWVFGALVAALTGGSFNSRFNGNSSFDSNDFPNQGQDTEINNKLQEMFGEEVGIVQGASDTSYGPLLDLGKSYIAEIPPSTWFLLVIAFIVMVVCLFLFNLLIRGYAKASLIGGIKLAHFGQLTTLKTISKEGLKFTKDMILLAVIPSLIILGVAVLIFVPVGLLSLVNPFITIAFGAILAIPFLFLIFALTIMIIWAERIIVYEGLSAMNAIKASMKFIKFSFWETVLLGFLNRMLSCVFSCLSCGAILLILGFFGLILWGGFAVEESTLLITLPIILIVGVLLIVLLALVNGIYKVFNYTSWNILYEDIKAEKQIMFTKDSDHLVKTQNQNQGQTQSQTQVQGQTNQNGNL